MRVRADILFFTNKISNSHFISFLNVTGLITFVILLTLYGVILIIRDTLYARLLPPPLLVLNFYFFSHWKILIYKWSTPRGPPYPPTECYVLSELPFNLWQWCTGHTQTVGKRKIEPRISGIVKIISFFCDERGEI
jgi:hypothetical protein